MQESHLLLFMEGLKDKLTPGAQRPNSSYSTSLTVKVICHILSQHFNSSCTGLWVDSDSEAFGYVLVNSTFSASEDTCIITFFVFSSSRAI